MLYVQGWRGTAKPPGTVFQERRAPISVRPLKAPDIQMARDDPYKEGSEESECEDEECQECEDPERPLPVVRKGPHEPTDREVEEHQITHLPYRSWCKICVAARGVAAPHNMIERSDNELPLISMDYYFWGGT